MHKKKKGKKKKETKPGSALSRYHSSCPGVAPDKKNVAIQNNR
jgi:hypothetical protein